jgi:hypothetical protein
MDFTDYKQTHKELKEELRVARNERVDKQMVYDARKDDYNKAAPDQKKSWEPKVEQAKGDLDKAKSAEATTEQRFKDLKANNRGHERARQIEPLQNSVKAIGIAAHLHGAPVESDKLMVKQPTPIEEAKPHREDKKPEKPKPPSREQMMDGKSPDPQQGPPKDSATYSTTAKFGQPEPIGKVDLPSRYGATDKAPGAEKSEGKDTKVPQLPPDPGSRNFGKPAGDKAGMDANTGAGRDGMKANTDAGRNGMNANTAAGKDGMSANTAAGKDGMNANTAAGRDGMNANTQSGKDGMNANVAGSRHAQVPPTPDSKSAASIASAPQTQQPKNPDPPKDR